MTHHRQVRGWPLALSALLAGCSATTGIGVKDVPYPTVRSSWAQAGITDARQPFSAVFCRHLQATPATAMQDCARWWWPIEAGATGVADRPLSDPLPATRDLVIIPGIFGECVAPWVTPFSHDHAALAALGYRVSVADVEGRASAARNADHLHTHLARLPEDANAVIIAYSKGTTDVMLAASQPQAAAWRHKVSALIAVAGAVQGSPLADDGHTLYRDLARFDLPTCDRSDAGGVSSLTHAEAMRVADAFAASRPPFPTYSVVAVAERGNVNSLLAGTHAWLSLIDARNDGQVLLEDAVIPGSTVLGVFRADHWSIALPFEDSPAPLMRPFRRNNHFPRGPLVRAMLEFTAPVAASRVTTKEE